MVSNMSYLLAVPKLQKKNRAVRFNNTKYYRDSY